jgi:hypothetical protein
MDQLLHNNLLQSIYAETLRLYVQSYMKYSSFKGDAYEHLASSVRTIGCGRCTTVSTLGFASQLLVSGLFLWTKSPRS